VTTGDERLDYADRWLRDGLRVLRPDLSVLQITVDMTNASTRLAELRRTGVQATATHLLVHAAAQALKANPGVHQLIAGNTRHRPTRVDIGLSVTGETFVAPVLVIEGADTKTVAEIAAETAQRAPEARRADQQMLRMLRRWGWLVPFGFMRRSVLRLLFSNPAFRRKGAGTFQVSTVPVDWAFTTSFATAGVLFGGQMMSRVVVVDGQPAVRPTMTLTLSGDHGVWDGRTALRFVSAVKARLESAQESAQAT
jgi:pyruvate/2-oxoglutarate dehydrogenase complex dihydrolipoamide acyltransferase (E2) component